MIALIVGSTASCYRTRVTELCSGMCYRTVFLYREQDMRSALRIARAACEKVLSVALDVAGFAKV